MLEHRAKVADAEMKTGGQTPPAFQLSSGNVGKHLSTMNQ